MSARQFRVLYREFLFHIVDLEILAPGGDLNKLLGQLAAILVTASTLLAAAGLMVADSQVPTHRRFAMVLSEEHLLITATMLTVGLFAVLTWDSVFPTVLDALVLGPLPVRARTVFFAKVCAGATAVLSTVLALHVFAGVAWPLALYTQTCPHVVPSLEFDPPIAPVSAPDLKSVLERDLAGHPFRDDATVAVYRQGRRRIFSFGAAQAGSMFQIGSITKTFTALVLADMVARGEVSLSMPVRELLPRGTVGQTAGPEITLLDLAIHRSGLPPMPDNFTEAGYDAPRLFRYIAGRGVVIAGQPSFVYSNLGYGLLGTVLCLRFGASYPELIRSRITDPLGLHDTAIFLSPAQAARVIPGHDVQGKPVPVTSAPPDALAGAGSIVTTAGDLLAYIEAQLHPPPALARAVDISHRLRASAEGDSLIALAWMNDPSTGVYYHAGSSYGYTAYAAFHPGQDWGMVCLINSGPPNVSYLLGEHMVARLTGRPPVSLGSVSVDPPRGLPGFLRTLLAYWTVMTAAGAFMYSLVVGVQGIASLALSRRLFLRLSPLFQLTMFCGIVGVCFFEPSPAGLLTEPREWALMKWLPSYWFLGLYHQLLGSSAFAPLALRAWVGGAIVALTSVVVYVLSYRRAMRNVVEASDLPPAPRLLNRLPRFGNAVQTALVHFSLRTLMRSREHRAVLVFYLGFAFSISLLLLRTPLLEAIAGTGESLHRVNTRILIVTLITMVFWTLGTRIVFARPLNLRANWTFRTAPLAGPTDCHAARRTAFLVLAVFPVWTASAVIVLCLWPTRAAAGHQLILGLFGLTIAELCLLGTERIPFTCAYLPGKANVHMVVWGAAVWLFALVGRAAEMERRALETGRHFLLIVVALAASCLAAYILARPRHRTLDFEESDPDELVTLKLT